MACLLSTGQTRINKKVVSLLSDLVTTSLTKPRLCSFREGGWDRESPGTLHTLSRRSSSVLSGPKRPNSPADSSCCSAQSPATASTKVRGASRCPSPWTSRDKWTSVTVTTVFLYANNTIPCWERVKRSGKRGVPYQSPGRCSSQRILIVN